MNFFGDHLRNKKKIRELSFLWYLPIVLWPTFQLIKLEDYRLWRWILSPALSLFLFTISNDRQTWKGLNALYLSPHYKLRHHLRHQFSLNSINCVVWSFPVLYWNHDVLWKLSMSCWNDSVVWHFLTFCGNLSVSCGNFLMSYEIFQHFFWIMIYGWLYYNSSQALFDKRKLLEFWGFSLLIF